jgi:hypothetical protein
MYCNISHVISLYIDPPQLVVGPETEKPHVPCPEIAMHIFGEIYVGSLGRIKEIVKIFYERIVWYES